MAVQVHRVSVLAGNLIFLAGAAAELVIMLRSLFVPAVVMESLLS